MSTTKTWAQVARHTESEPIMNINTEPIESIIDINNISIFPDIKNNRLTNTLLVSKESITEVTDITDLIKNTDEDTYENTDENDPWTLISSKNTYNRNTKSNCKP